MEGSLDCIYATVTAAAKGTLFDEKVPGASAKKNGATAPSHEVRLRKWSRALLRAADLAQNGQLEAASLDADGPMRSMGESPDPPAQGHGAHEVTAWWQRLRSVATRARAEAAAKASARVKESRRGSMVAMARLQRLALGL